MNTQSILLVEDNPDDIALMLHALSDNQIANPDQKNWPKENNWP